MTPEAARLVLAQQAETLTAEVGLLERLATETPADAPGLRLLAQAHREAAAAYRRAATWTGEAAGRMGRVAWTQRDGSAAVQMGEPIAIGDAEVFAREMDKKYPRLTHWVEPC